MKRNKRLITLISSILILLYGGIVYMKKGLNLGIDFSGGHQVQLNFNQKMETGKIRSQLKQMGLNNLIVQPIDHSQHQFLIQYRSHPQPPPSTDSSIIEGSFSDKIQKYLINSPESTLVREEMIGSDVSENLNKKASQTAFWVIVSMLIYIGFRFKLIYGLAAVITLFHDTLLCLALITIFRIEMSLPVFAAILTIIGYSLNDTIVIFDRVRSHLKTTNNKKHESMETLLNKSINQTLSRTLVTTATTITAILAVILFGGSALFSFALVLLIGVIIGTYSSVFQACLWLFLGKRML